MHLKFYGSDSTNHFHLLLYANLRRQQSSTFDSTSWNSTFVYHIFSISGSKISIVGVFERSHLSRSVFRANFRFDFPICGKFQSSSLHTFVPTYPMRIEKNLLWNYSSSKNSNIGPINMRLRERVRSNITATYCRSAKGRSIMITSTVFAEGGGLEEDPTKEETGKILSGKQYCPV